MKQIDNRQKEQIQLKAQKSRISKHIHESKGQGGGQYGHGRSENASGAEVNAEPYHAAPKIGRNDPCSCGSGKKFKKCCLIKTAEPPAEGER